MQFDSEKKQLTIGVRELCRLAYTSGDIDAHRAPTEFDVDNHRLIESHAENGALIECPLDITVPYLDFEIHIRGRADIIHAATNDGEKLHPAEVEEIKTVPPQMLGARLPNTLGTGKAICPDACRKGQTHYRRMPPYLRFTRWKENTFVCKTAYRR